MDGPIGKQHPRAGAKLAGWLLDDNSYAIRGRKRYEWYYFCLFHSAYFCKAYDEAPSRLYYADKLSFIFQNKGLYLWMTELTGELDEYILNSEKYFNRPFDPETWYDQMVHHMRSRCERLVIA